MERVVAQPDHQRPRTADEGVHWAAFIGAPTVWFVYLNVAYGLVPIACSHGAVWAIWLGTFVAAALAGACGVAGLLRWRRGTRTGDIARDERVRFMVHAGAAVSALFVVLILVQGLASVVFSPCEGWAVHW